jgi:hypothetical protein
MSDSDTANVGLSENMHFKLSQMKEEGIFHEMKDGYRLAIAIAIFHDIDASKLELAQRKNMYDVGGIDEDGIIKSAIRLKYPLHEGQEYKLMEKLADAGMQLLDKKTGFDAVIEPKNILKK